MTTTLDLIRPQIGTRRRPERSTSGSRQARFARALGVRLHPWQRYVLDVAGEIDPATGRHAYRDVILAVPRRSGKSLIGLVKQIDTILTGRHRRGWYTAQTRSDAALILTEEWSTAIEDSQLAPMIHTRRSNGSESLIAPEWRSACRVFAPTRTAGHGQDGDVFVFDECWAHSREVGAELLGAASPATATRPDAQLWHLSAAGDIDSTWWLDLLDRGRRAVEADAGYGIAHFEWTADPTAGVTYDLADPATWTAVHPAAYPGGTVTLQWLHAEYERDPAGFMRTVLNITDRTGLSADVIDQATWRDLSVAPPDRADIEQVTIGVDVAPDHTAAAIVAAFSTAGVCTVELIDHRDGYAWTVERVAQLCDTWPVTAVAVAGSAGVPATVVRRPLETIGAPLHVLTAADETAAAADMVAAIRTGGVRHVRHVALDAAAQHAQRKLVGDGTWTWRRDGAGADQSPLIAACWARWAHPDTLGAGAPGIT